MKKILSILLLFILCCKGSNAQKVFLTNEEWKLYSTNLLKELREIRLSEELEPNGGHSYKKNNSNIHIELLEEMKTNKKIIDYSIVKDSSNIIFLRSTRFFLSNENRILLITTEESKSTNNSKKLRDTILMENGKIKFWKNNTKASIKEVTKKEKEIFDINEEIKEYIE